MNQDIADLLKPEGEISSNSDLPIINVWRLAVHYVMFFMTQIDKFKSHYDQDVRKSYLCLGHGCPACAAGLKSSEHIYLPVWDVQGRRIVILRVDTRNDGPARQVARFIQTYRDKLADIVAVIDCQGDRTGRFTITAHSPLPETDRGALACKAFCDGLENGAIELRDCIQRLTIEDIGKLPSVQKLSMKLVGEPVGPSCKPSSNGHVAGPLIES